MGAARSVPPRAPSEAQRPPLALVMPAPTEHLFSGKSCAEMIGVHSDITLPAHVALRLCPIDFSFYDGLRTREEQKRNVASGASHTEESKHFDGNAGDLVPYVDGALVWREPECIHVARSMQTAIRFLGISLIWGAIWDRNLETLSDDLEREIALYRARFKKQRPTKKPFFDGVHFQRVNV